MNYSNERPAVISLNNRRQHHKTWLSCLGHNFFFFLQCLQFRYSLCGAHKSSAHLLNRYMMNTTVKRWLKSLVQWNVLNLNPSCPARDRCHLNVVSPMAKEAGRGKERESPVETLIVLLVSPLGHRPAVRLTSKGLWLWPAAYRAVKDDSRAAHKHPCEL